jgi:hypothetical protein
VTFVVCLKVERLFCLRAEMRVDVREAVVHLLSAHREQLREALLSRATAHESCAEPPTKFHEGRVQIVVSSKAGEISGKYEMTVSFKRDDAGDLVRIRRLAKARATRVCA